MRDKDKRIRIEVTMEEFSRLMDEAEPGSLLREILWRKIDAIAERKQYTEKIKKHR